MAPVVDPCQIRVLPSRKFRTRVPSLICETLAVFELMEMLDLLDLEPLLDLPKDIPIPMLTLEDLGDVTCALRPVL